MQAIFSPQKRIETWRRLWLALAEAQQSLGLERISDQAIHQMRAAISQIDFTRAAAHEQRTRHDVMAHIHTFGEAAPAARGIIHLGATSAYVVDNADLILMREALDLLARKIAGVIQSLARFARAHRDLPCLAYTHFQPAQLTTLGKRACLWLADFTMDLHELEHRNSGLRLRGVKGTTGTQASMLELFEQDHARVVELERRVAAAMGFAACYPVTGQTYSRKVDAQVCSALACLGTSIHKFANDIRLLQGTRQLEEPFEAGQVGSSAMAYKRNPMRMERATGLARFVISLASSPLMTAAEQWFERTLDDSSNKRLVIPEAFLAMDGAVDLVRNVADGIVVHPNVIHAAVQRELPFMATETILMHAVRAGADRQEAHEAIRQASNRAQESVALGHHNPLLEHLADHPLFAALIEQGRLDLSQLADARMFIGRSHLQTDEYLSTTIEPLLERYAGRIPGPPVLRV